MNKIFFFSIFSFSIISFVKGQNCSDYEKLYSENQFKIIIQNAGNRLSIDNNDMCALNYLLLSLHASKKYDDLKSLTSKAIEDELSGKIQFSPEVYGTISAFFEVKSFGMIYDPETNKNYDYRFLLPLFDNFRETKRMPSLVAEKLFFSIKNNSYLSGKLNESKIVELYIKSYGFKKGINLEICKFLNNEKYSTDLYFKEYLDLKNPTAKELEEFYLYLNNHELRKIKLAVSNAYLKIQGFNKSTNSDILKFIILEGKLEDFISTNFNLETFTNYQLEDIYNFLKQSSTLSEEESKSNIVRVDFEILYKIALLYIKKYGYESEMAIEMMDYLNKFLVISKNDKNNYKEIDVSQNFNKNQRLKKLENASWEKSRAKLPQKSFIETIETGNVSFRDNTFLTFQDTKLENDYKNFKNNKSNTSTNDIFKLLEASTKKYLYVRSNLALIELIKRNPSNAKLQNDFIQNLGLLPIELFLSFKNVYKNDIDIVSDFFVNNDTLVLKYNKLLFERKLYEEAYNNLSKSVKTPDTKLLLVNCTIKYKGLLQGIDYLMGEKPRAAAAYNILLDLSFNLNTNEILTATKHIYTNYRKAVDSIDITALGNFTYDRSGDAIASKIIGKEINLEELKWIARIYREFEYKTEAFAVECEYWISKNLEVDEIDKAVLKKDLNPIIASAIFLNYGMMCKEEAFRGGGSGVDRVRGRNDCVVVLNKAANYNPKDPYIYKELGFVWQLIGDGNKADF